MIGLEARIGRCAGVLLHPTSLPDAHEVGALGAPAEAFLKFMRASGLRVWQMLPVGPVHLDRSPYRALSLNAGGEHLISLRDLCAEPWLRVGGGFARVGPRAHFLDLAADRFHRHGSGEIHRAFQDFVERERTWLEPYCAFRVLRRRWRNLPWQRWPSPWRDDAGNAIARLSVQAHEAMERERIVQFLFDRQWSALRRSAAAAGVVLFGDVPFYPAPDSVDVWYDRDLFQLDAQGMPRATGGVPPDVFTPQGQAWGSVLYDWERMSADSFAWWRARLRVQGRRFDLLRLDHFRGFEAYWSIPVGASPAAGAWCPGPGAALLAALRAQAEPPTLVAEDLGLITPPVEALRRRFALPGIRVLQFAFNGDPANPHLPRNHETNSMACTGTHDTDTLAGWWRTLDGDARNKVFDALGQPRDGSLGTLCESLLASPATLAIVPMQDVLGLGSAARMNVPGRPEGNWSWCLRRDQSGGETARRLHAALRRAGRLPKLD